MTMSSDKKWIERSNRPRGGGIKVAVYESSRVGSRPLDSRVGSKSGGNEAIDHYFGKKKKKSVTWT